MTGHAKNRPGLNLSVLFLAVAVCSYLAVLVGRIAYVVLFMWLPSYLVGHDPERLVGLSGESYVFFEDPPWVVAHAASIVCVLLLLMTKKKEILMRTFVIVLSVVVVVISVCSCVYLARDILFA